VTRQLLVGVQLPEVEWEVPFPELIRMAQSAEAVGFDSVWLGDHLLYDLAVGPRGPWEVWTSLAALAASTERVLLGPLVASAGFHEPAMLAKQAATVDGISGGRLILGLGSGWNEREYRAFGFPFDRRVSRFEEAFTIIRTLLADGEIDFTGEFYRVENCVLHPRASRPGGPPLMVGSTRPRMLSITLPHVDAWNVWWSDYGNTPAGFAELKHVSTPTSTRPAGGRAASRQRAPCSSAGRRRRASDGWLRRTPRRAHSWHCSRGRRTDQSLCRRRRGPRATGPGSHHTRHDRVVRGGVRSARRLTTRLKKSSSTADNRMWM
jgi:alkanesulfonate monooxygenase SsuD/methylene tetrahydromethanopterin reductase-like flavin-dependent oxidoreductase (luciferase family)